MQIAPIFQLVESTLLARRKSWQPLWPVTRALVVGVTAFASFIIPDMEKMVALTGGVFFSFIGFILPGAFFLKLRPPPAEGRSSPSVSLADVARASALIMLGVVGGGFSVWGELFSAS